MRIDIYEKVSLYKMNDLKPNFSEVARTYGCDPRTVKRYYEGGQNERKYTKKPSKLDAYKWKQVSFNQKGDSKGYLEYNSLLNVDKMNYPSNNVKGGSKMQKKGGMKLPNYLHFFVY